MMDEASWLSVNEEHLASAVAWLRLRLARMAARRQGSTSGAAQVTEADLEAARNVMGAFEAGDPPPALLLLRRLFRLSQFELDTFVLRFPGVAIKEFVSTFGIR